jgi:hypothetical protein
MTADGDVRYQASRIVISKINLTSEHICEGTIEPHNHEDILRHSLLAVAPALVRRPSANICVNLRTVDGSDAALEASKSEGQALSLQRHNREVEAVRQLFTASRSRAREQLQSG